jgi:hypothetical protein
MFEQGHAGELDGLRDPTSQDCSSNYRPDAGELQDDPR